MQNIFGKSNFIMGKVKVVVGQFDREMAELTTRYVQNHS